MAKPFNGSSDIWLLPEFRLEELFLSGEKHRLLHKDEDFSSLLFKQSHNSSASPKRTDNDFYPNPSAAQHMLQVTRFHYLKHQQLIKNQLSAARRTQSIAEGSRALGSSSSFSSSPPVLKSQPSSGMRAVFLNPRKESFGTGVFLPRQPGSHNKPKKQPACSIALLPATVVQALNLKLDELCFYPRAPTHGMGLAGYQKRSTGRSRSPSAAGPADRLPTEWTY